MWALGSLGLVWARATIKCAPPWPVRLDQGSGQPGSMLTIGTHLQSSIPGLCKKAGLSTVIELIVLRLVICTPCLCLQFSMPRLHMELP